MKKRGAALQLPALSESALPTAEQIDQSITPDALTSFIDGKSRKVLKRHLAEHGLDPDSYRLRYNLPRSYPMIAPGYAAERMAVAKSMGLDEYLKE